MPDRILVHRIAVFAYHGVRPEEETLGQRFFISLDCQLDLSVAGRSDAVERTANYEVLVSIAHRIATEHRFALIEGLAEAIAAEVLERFTVLDAVTVRIDKPGAPVPAVMDGVSIAITRTRAGGRPE